MASTKRVFPHPVGTLQQHRQTAAGRRAEDLHLIADRPVERRLRTERTAAGRLFNTSLPSFEGNDLRKLYALWKDKLARPD